LDSSTIAALASGAARQAGATRFVAVTAVSTDAASDERRYAGAVVRHCKLDWHTVTPTASDFVAEVDLSIRAQGEPALSPSTYFQYCVMREASAAGLKVMLDGQGADELLCGYERYAPVWALDTARRAGVFAAFRGFTSLARGSRPGLWGMTALAAYVLQPRLRRRVIRSRAWFLHGQYVDCVLELLARISNASRGLRQARLADIARFSLPALLRFEDRNSMAHSVEARVPYVDSAVVSCALRLPDEGLLQDGFTKYPLRMLGATVLPPDIAWRRSKVGFEPPTRDWLAALGHRMQVEVEQSSLVRRLCSIVPNLSDLPLAVQWRMYNLARWQHLFAVAVD
jgi:asparagine synthase (glutamine-hydrolysing)